MKTAIIINNEYFGHGDAELGTTLMGAFLRKLWAGGNLPDTIICYNSGVKLIAKGSFVLDAFDGLAINGVEIIACGTCIDFYNLNDHIKIGRRSNMAEIASIMMDYDKIITI